MKTDKEILENIQKWAEGNPIFLAQNTDYQRGRKAGILFSQGIILNLLKGGNEIAYI